MYYERQLKSLIIKIILKNYQIFESNFYFIRFFVFVVVEQNNNKALY